MKLLHTSDLHLGRHRRGKKLRATQRTMLQNIVDIACREQVDAVLLCGNICENAAGLALLRDFAEKLSAEGIVVCAVGGAQDKLPLSVEGVCTCDGVPCNVTLQDDHGTVVLHMLPQMSAQKALSVLGAMPLMLGVRNVLMLQGESAEELPLTGFDYVALGSCDGMTMVELGAMGDVQVHELSLQKID